MPRIVYDAMRILPAIICGGVAFLWLVSYVVPVTFQYANKQGQILSIHSNMGGVYVTLEYPNGAWSPPGFSLSTVQWLPEDNVGGVPIERWRGVRILAVPSGVTRQKYLVVSDWLLFIITAIPVAPLFLRWRRQRRRLTLGLCLNCGYDLRATPERCPECGSVKVSTVASVSQANDTVGE